jgi:hypothetical protein
MPDWHILYEAALGETNPAVFERLVFDAEDAIEHRLREMPKNPDGPLELNEISDAVGNILRLKTERLGWPDPTAPSNTVARYAHTLLFVCPECNLPVSISRICNEKSLEMIDAQSFHLECAYCSAFSAVVGATNKLHWVTEWPDGQGT